MQNTTDMRTAAARAVFAAYNLNFLPDTPANRPSYRLESIGILREQTRCSLADAKAAVDQVFHDLDDKCDSCAGIGHILCDNCGTKDSGCWYCLFTGFVGCGCEYDNDDYPHGRD